MSLTKTSNKNAGEFIRDRIPFAGSNFMAIYSSLTPDCFVPSYGMLPHTSIPDLIGADYIVYSYATPIAWYRNGLWHIPAYKYSQSTSRHQSYVRQALGL